MTDLDDHRLAEFDESETEREGYHIGGDREAAWALRKLRQAEAEIERLDGLKSAEIERITGWHHDVTHPLYGRTAFFTSLLIDYRHRLEMNDPDLPKTYPLPGGKLTRRKGSRRVVVTDVDALTAWAANNDLDAVKIEPRVSRFTTKGAPYALDETAAVVLYEGGERVPGVHVERDPDQYGVQTDGR